MEFLTLDNASLEALGLPSLVVVAALLAFFAFAIGGAIEAAKLLLMAIRPAWKEGAWWRFAVRASSIVLGAFSGWWLIDDFSAPSWGVLIGVVAGSVNAAIRYAVKMNIRDFGSKRDDEEAPR